LTEHVVGSRPRQNGLPGLNAYLWTERRRPWRIVTTSTSLFNLCVFATALNDWLSSSGKDAFVMASRPLECHLVTREWPQSPPRWCTLHQSRGASVRFIDASERSRLEWLLLGSISLRWAGFLPSDEQVARNADIGLYVPIWTMC